MTRLRGLVALLALGFLIGAVPWALLRFGDWPIKGLPSGEQLRDLGDTVVSDTAVFAVLTIAAWLVWAVFMASVLVEGAAVARGVQAPRLVLAGPLQRSARGLVAAVVLAITIQQGPRPAAAGAAPGPSVHQSSPVVLDINPTTAPTAPTPAPATTTPVSAEAADEVVTVGAGDSAWSIAETHLGDGMRWRQLWEINRGVTQPDGRSWTDPQIIRVGWQIRIPTSITRTTTEPAAEVHTVVRGDTLSEIADTDLGDPDRYTEIFDVNRDIEQPDGRRLTNPDLIIPGWNLRLPTDAAPAPLMPEPPPTSPEVADPAPTPTTQVPTPDTTPPTTVPAMPAPTSTTTSLPMTPPIEAPAVIDRGADQSEGDWIATAPTLAGLASAVVLASALTLRIRFLRRRQATRGAAAHRALPTESGQTEDAIVAAADVPLVRWAGQHLAQLVLQLDRRALTGAPVAVELSDTAGVEVLWDTPQPDAPEGWTVADGGWAWRLTYDPDAPIPIDALPAAIPALVTIGHRDGRQLMIDLEAYGAISVSGADDRVDSFLRSIALELAADQDLADAYVQAVGFDPGIGKLDRLGTIDAEGAVRRLEGVRQSVTEALDVAHVNGTFAARTGSGTPIDVNVVIAHPANGDELNRLLQAAPPHRGVAVIAAGDEGTAPAHIELRGDGTGRIEPLGIVFTPVAIPADSAAALDGLLDALDAPPVVPGNGHLEIPDHQRGDGAGVEAATTNSHPRHSGNGEKATILSDGFPAPDADQTVAAELFPADSDGGTCQAP